MKRDPASDTSPWSRTGVSVAVVLAFAVPALALIFAGVQRTASYADQVEYHLPTIEQFARQWPAFDFSSYPAAMTPGYHLLMAAILKVGGCVLALQLATLAITAGLLATLAWTVSRRFRPLDAVLLCLPMAWSQYVLLGGVYVVPHNLAWWGALVILIIVTAVPWSAWSAVAGGGMLAATVLVRQIHLWPAAGIVTAATFADGVGFDHIGVRARRTLIALACCLPAIGVLFYFYTLWGSLAPTSQPWAKPADGVNVAAIAMVLATFGLLAPLLIGRFPADRRQWLATVVGGTLGAIVALSTATTYDSGAGRWSGLWNLANLLGTVADRSVLITLLSSAGAASVGLLLASLDKRQAYIWAVLIAGFAASSAAVNLAWQRYYEPLVLMAVILMLRAEPRVSAMQRCARVAIAGVQVALLVMALRAA